MSKHISLMYLLGSNQENRPVSQHLGFGRGSIYRRYGRAEMINTVDDSSER
jgi:hypothetical protein